MAATGPRNLVTDVPRILVGQAEDRDGITGTTVVLAEQPAMEEQGCVRHLQFTEPLSVIMNSRNSQGVIYKPRSI